MADWATQLGAQTTPLDGTPRHGAAGGGGRLAVLTRA